MAKKMTMKAALIKVAGSPADKKADAKMARQLVAKGGKAAKPAPKKGKR